MLKLCAAEVATPLQIIFSDCINCGISRFFEICQCPIHKKDNRQIKSNYRPISLLAICGKILEKIVFDQVYAFLNINNLISKNQGIQLYINYFLSLQLFMIPLKIMTKHVLYSWIFLKHLIRFGMKAYFLK